MAQTVKCLPDMQETWVRFLGREDPLEKEMTIHSSTLAWKIPWMEEPDRLQSMGSQRVGHDWATSRFLREAYNVSLCHWPPQRTYWMWFPNGCIKPSVTERACLLSCSVVSDSLQPVECSLPGSSVHGILQARILEWVAIPFSRGSYWPRDRIPVSCIASRFSTIWATGEASLRKE